MRRFVIFLCYERYVLNARLANPKKKTPAVHEIALNNPVARARVWLGPCECGLNQHVIPGPADWSGGKCCYAQRKDIFLLMIIFLLPLSYLEETNIYYPIIGFV